MSRKRRHGPPARNRQPRMYEAPRHMSPNMPSGAVGMREHPAGNGNGGSGGATAVVLRDEQGAPYVVLADGGSAASAYAQGGRQTQQAAAQSAQMQRLRNPLTGMTAGAAKPYPDMPQISDAKPFLKSLGATGTAIFSGIITSEEYNADFYWKDAIQIYEQMSRNDAQIYAIKQLLELPIRRATWTVEPGGDTPRDKEIASFVETCLFHDMRYETSEGRVLTQKWDDVLRHILMMLWFGFMAFEVNWRIEDGWTKWARWTPLLPRTIWRWWVGEDNELVGVQQWTYKDYTYVFVDIPADKLLLFTHRQEGNNYEGVSALRSAYKHWYYKDTFYKIQAIDIERNGVSMPVMHLPENFTQDDLNQAQTILANMRANESMGVTLPPGWQLDFGNTHGSSRGGPGTQIDSAIEHHDNMIARNVLGQFINLGSHEVGSYALADTQRAMLLAALQAECEYIEDVINNDAITRLVDYNFDGVESYPRLKASKLIAQDLDVISTALSKLNSSPSGPMIHADAELEDYLRDLYGLPKAPAGIVAGTNPTAPSTPERPETDAAQETAGSDHADAESKDAQPAVRQQATSQAIANGTPSVSGRAAAGSTSVQSSEAALTEEARLLREALAAAYDHDAVERGLVFYNPAHIPAGSPQGGEFAPKGGGEGGMGGGGMGGGVHAARGGSGHARGRTASGGGRGRSSGAAHRGGSGGTGRSSGGGSSKASKTKDEGEAKTKARATKPKPTEEEKYQAKRAKLQAEIEGHRQEAERASQERIAAVNRSDLEAAGEATMRSAYHAVTQGEAERKLAALDRAHARTVAKSAAAEGKSEGARSRGSSKAAKSEEAAGRSTTGAKSAREANLEAQLAAVRAENAALRAGSARAGGKATKTGEAGAKASGRGKGGKTAEETLRPITTAKEEPGLNRRFDPYQAPDARYLRVLYGDHQLSRALKPYSHESLRETARRLGTAPGRSKAATISGIVSHVTREPYQETVAKLRRATEHMNNDISNGGKYDAQKNYYAEE